MNKFAIAVLFCLSAATGFAQCTTERVNARKEMMQSSAVIVGTVIAAEPVPEAWDFLDGVNYTVRVDTKIRGKAKANTEVVVFSENSPRFFAMYVGQQYMLYLQPQYGRNQVDVCGNSHSLEASTSSASTKAPSMKAVKGF